MSCKKTGADKMIDFMRVFVSVAQKNKKTWKCQQDCRICLSPNACALNHCRWKSAMKRDASVRQLMLYSKKCCWLFWPRYVVTNNCVRVCVPFFLFFCLQVLSVQFIHFNRLLVCKILKIEQVRWLHLFNICICFWGPPQQGYRDSQNLWKLFVTAGQAFVNAPASNAA